MSIPFKLAFGITLRRMRQTYNLSQAELASKARVSQAAVSDLERGRKTSSLETLQNLATSFDITASDFLAIVEGASPMAEVNAEILRRTKETLAKEDGWMSLEEAEKQLGLEDAE